MDAQSGTVTLSDGTVLANAQGVSEFAPGTMDGPGWLTHPVDTDRLRDYWTHGRGAAKIMWGAPGDFNRCRANLAKYVKPQHLSGYCFTGDTEFLTRDGVRTFADTVGSTVEVLTMKEPLGRGASPVAKSGYWVEAPVESFGEQAVLSVTLRRGKDRKVIRATREHEWFVSDDAKSAKRLTARKVTTDSLAPGMAMASLLPMPVAKKSFTSTRWVVESVEDHGEAEEVFCVVVPETETFALADYIWTHNCANRHYDALGFWPGDHRRILKHSNDGEIMAPSVRLVASGGTDAPPREWFDDPGLTGPSPIVVTEEGRVFGHLATWGTCHIGFKDACTTPPQSMSDYAYFQTGAVLTTDGEVAVGQITVDTGHAGLSLSARPAAAHYDDTGTAVADVCAGEDEHGIYIAGAVRSTATPEQVARLRASALSGDWRTIGGNLELVAALAVNVPGFPIPRTSLAASAGHQTALVAAGIVEVAGQQVERASLEEIVGRAVDERLSADRRKSEMSQIMVKAGRDPRSRMKAIAKNRKG